MRKRKGGSTSKARASAQVKTHVDKTLPSGPPNGVHNPPAGMWPCAAIVFAAVLGIYVKTLYPYVSGGDSGELIVTCCNWGVAHPPGYPLYTMLGAVWSRWFTVGTMAYRVNFLNAVQGSLAALSIHLTTAQLSGSSWAGVAAACGYAFCPLVWLYSVQGEVFGLNNLLVSLMCLLSVKYFQQSAVVDRAGAQQESAARRKLVFIACTGAFVSGLAATNQHTTIFSILPTVMFVVLDLVRLKNLTPLTICALTLSSLLGLSPYAYLVVAAGWKSMDSWGDQRTLSGFLHHFLRREYGTFQLAAKDTTDDPGMWIRLGVYYKDFLQETLYVGPVLLVIGLVWTFWPKRPLRVVSMLFLVEYVFYMVVFHYLANLDPLRPLFMGVQARFWQQPNIYAFIWIGIGLSAVANWVVGLLGQPHNPPAPKPKPKPVRKSKSGKQPSASVASSQAGDTKAVKASVSGASNKNARVPWPQVVAAVFALLFATAQCSLNLAARDNSDNKVFQAKSEAVLATFPRDSIVILNGDLNNNLMKYPQQCEGVRPDLRLVSLQLMTWDWFVKMQAHNYPGVKFPGFKYHPREPGAFSLLQFLDANIDKFEIFLCGPFKAGDETYKAGYEVLPFGECGQLVRKGHRPRHFARYLRRSIDFLPNMTALGPFQPHKYTEDTWEYAVYTDIWTRLQFLTSHVSFQSNQNPSNKRLLRTAKYAVDRLFSDELRPFIVGMDMLNHKTHYRDGGIVLGQYSKLVQTKRPELAQECERRMMQMWQKYLEFYPNDKQIGQLVKDRINPYIGRKVP